MFWHSNVDVYIEAPVVPLVQLKFWYTMYMYTEIFNSQKNFKTSQKNFKREKSEAYF